MPTMSERTHLALWFLLLLPPAVSCSLEPPAAILDLSGTWRFALDRGDRGVTDGWFKNTLSQTIRLPGSVTENGFGDEVSTQTAWTGGIVDQSWFTDPRYEPYRRPGNIKIPFWLTPLKYYKGPAWYQKQVTISADWRGRYIELFLERCHWETRLWIDQTFVGTQNSLSTPHRYNLTDRLSPGQHTITIRVDNSLIINIGPNSHSVSDHTQTNWNGIIGRLELRASDPIRIDDLQVYPDTGIRTCRVQCIVKNATDLAGAVTLHLQAESWNAERPHRPAGRDYPVTLAAGENIIEVDYPLGDDSLLWDEFSPNLYRLTATVEGLNCTDTRSTIFGLRKFTTEGTHFAVNGRKTFLRGTLECCIFPLTGYPPTDAAGWLRILRVAKAHGLNHLRFHSWCPPEAAFAAADQAGVYFQIECASWANQGASIGDGKPVDQFIRDEGDRILKAYGNHPSFCMLAYGNEPAGGRQKEYLTDLVNSWKARDPRRLYTSAAGWPIIPASDYHSTPAPRGHQWGAGLNSRYNAAAYASNYDYGDFIRRYDVPVVSHEIGQWCVYPNFQEIQKYTGCLRAGNFEIFRQSLADHHLLDQAGDFLRASGRLQALLYKEEIEAALRTAGFGGFQLLDLHDFPGQGTALVGILDAFWDQKGYIRPAEFHRFCGETVPLVRMDRCIWTSDETFSAQAELAHFGPLPLADALPQWSLRYADGRSYAGGELAAFSCAQGNGIKLGRIQIDLGRVATPARMTLIVALKGTDYRNSWPIWVYPARLDVNLPTSNSDIRVAETLDESVQAALAAGGTVLWMPPAGRIAGNVALGFTTIFWNTQWTRNQPPHTLGILCDPDHPALRQFPTEFHGNWQWPDLIHGAGALILDDFDPEFRPIVQVIDDWNTNRKLGLLFEAHVGKGRLLACSMDLRTDLDNRPVARQMLHSLRAYLRSETFRPQFALEIPQLQSLLQAPSTMQRLGARVIYADSQATGYEADKAIDNDQATIWHTAWDEGSPTYPHEIQIDLRQEVTIGEIRYLPRQDMTNGRFTACEWYLSGDGQDWSEPILVVSLPGDAATCRWVLEPARRGRFLRLVAREGLDNQSFASAAELEIVLAEPAETTDP
ncbi:MAG: discoidin domain-containing protein [Sedimentisphaerales bacterium]|nr:discoidin domain-containing protein [Sedimentisphaerales bacterium]